MTWALSVDEELKQMPHDGHVWFNPADDLPAADGGGDTRPGGG